ncbi:MAG: hypothetical protein RL701_2145, partial [Pseudomonadota bacterium]
ERAIAAQALGCGRFVHAREIASRSVATRYVDRARVAVVTRGPALGGAAVIARLVAALYSVATELLAVIVVGDIRAVIARATAIAVFRGYDRDVRAVRAALIGGTKGHVHSARVAIVAARHAGLRGARGLAGFRSIDNAIAAALRAVTVGRVLAAFWTTSVPRGALGLLAHLAG